MLRNYRRLKDRTKIFIPIVTIMSMAIFWIVFSYSGVGTENSKKYLANSVDWLVAKAVQDPRGMILTTMPALAWQDTPEEMESPGQALVSWFTGITRIDFNPLGILRAQIPLLAQTDQQGAAVITVSPELSSETEKPVLAGNLSKDVLVGIYSTHTGETYTLTDGTDRLEGKKGGVVKVAGELRKKLEEKYSIKVDFSDKVHDARYATSYLESEKTARQMVANNPQMITMIDVHRDGGRTREESLVEVKGKKTAPILFIIGSDARRPFPNWKQNYQFACTLAERINKLYPGLCQGVRVKEGRYNQFLHPGAILVEIGSDSNTLEEALASADMFADALAQVVNELPKVKEKVEKQTEPAEKLKQTQSDGTLEDETLEEETEKSNTTFSKDSVKQIPEEQTSQ